MDIEIVLRSVVHKRKRSLEHLTIVEEIKVKDVRFQEASKSGVPQRVP